jgi:hypothetical protein
LSTADGSIATHIPTTMKSAIDQERTLVLLYEPDGPDMVTPAIQVAGSPSDNPVKVYVDRLEIFILEKESQYLGSFFFAQP